MPFSRRVWVFQLLFVWQTCLIPDFLAADDDTEKSLAQANDLETRSVELYRQGNYSEAIPLAKKGYEINSRILGEEHPRTARSLNNLAALLYATGRYDEAEPVFQRALKVREKLLGADHADTIQTVHNLPGVYLELADFTASEHFYRRALAAKERIFGTDHPATADTMNSLALLCTRMGQYEEAERLHRRAIAIQEKTIGPDHPDTTRGWNNLGLLYLTVGDYAAAEPIFRRVLETREKVLGPDHPLTANSLNNLAGLHHEMGSYAQAEPLYRRAMEITARALGEEHPDTAGALLNLGGLYYEMERLDAAEPLYQQGLRLTEKTLGAEHPQTAIALLNLAALYERVGRYEEAEKLTRRALVILERTLGPKHPITARALDNLAVLLVARDHPAAALDFADRASKIWEAHRQQIFAFATEREQVAFAETRRGAINIYLSLAAEHLPDNDAARRFALSIALSTKGMILEILSSRHADILGGHDPELKRLYNEWQSAGQKLLQTTLAVPAPGELKAREAKLAELERRKEAAEQTLARASSRFASQRQAQSVRIADIARTLTDDSALVEFVKYQSFRFDARSKTNEWGKWKYLALVLRGGTNDVSMVSLGKAEPIEAAIKEWRRSAGVPSGEEWIPVAAADLASLVWKPLATSLKDCRKIYLSPDGELAFVSFGALSGRDPGKFLIEECDIRYVATGRDLVRSVRGDVGAPLLVGAPEFGKRKAESPVQTASAQSLIASLSPLNLRSFRGLNFPPFPGTQKEVETIERLLTDRKEKPIRLTGANATEAAVKAVHRPALLHLATHGFFLPEILSPETAMTNSTRGVGGARPLAAGIDGLGSGKVWREIRLKNPMHRSGIALSGANDTVEGRHPLGGDDGILTAEEVASMDLWGTRSVVISACESGLGEARGNEGVFGLRRAFTMAGAQSLVMSLWSVSDESTGKLMEALYRELGKTESMPNALATAQRAWIEKERAVGRYPHPFHWAAFVASGSGLHPSQGNELKGNGRN